MKKKNHQKKQLAVSLAVTLALVGAGMSTGHCVDTAALINRLFFPLFRLMVFITLGLAAGQVIEATGWTRQLSVVARPFFRFSNLGNRCSAAFTAAFVSGVAANAMLLEFFKQKKITRAQLFLTNYINQLPAFFLHLPTTFFIVVPLTGKAGIFYFLLTFSATLLRTICFLVFGFWYKPLASKTGLIPENTPEERAGGRSKAQEIFKGIRTKLPSRVMGVAVYVLPIYTLVFVLNINGFFEFLNQTVSHSLTLSFMPVESLSVVVLSFAAEFTSGFAAAGALMSAGVLTTKQTVIALLMGNVIAFPIRALRHQLPRYMGIFSPKMGFSLLLSGQFFRIVSIIIVGLIYYGVA